MIEPYFAKWSSYRRFVKSSFIRSVSVLAGGTAFAQGVMILATPILTRLYTPTEFGVLGVYSAFLSVLIVISALRYEVAIPLPKSDGSATNILGLSLVCVTGITIATFFTVALYRGDIAQLTNIQEYGEYLWFLPIGIACGGFGAVFQSWAIRKKAFRRIARTRVEQSISGAGTQILMGCGGAGVLGLILGQVLNQGGGLFGLARRAFKEDSLDLRKISAHRMKLYAARYDRFPKYSFFEALANSAGVQLPLIVIATMAGSAKEVGYLMLAMRIMQAPLGVMGTSIGQVYFSRAVDEERQGTLGAFTERTIVGLVKVGVGPLLFTGILAPVVIPIIFGMSWQRSGNIISWMIPWFVFQYLSAPIAMVMHVTAKQRVALLLQLFGVVLRTSSIYVSAILISPRLATEAYAISGLVFYFVAMFAICIAANVSLSRLLRSLLGTGPVIIGWVVAGTLVFWIIKYV